MPQEKLEGFLAEGAGGHETLDRIGAGLVTVRWLRPDPAIGSSLDEGSKA